jgi:polyisoprenoid-binding protein YceI
MKLAQVILKSALVAGLTFAVNWNVDTANSKINFTVKGPFGTVNGSFGGLKATIKFEENDLPGSAIQANVDAKTVSTGIGIRNHHLRNEEEWLNTDKYPTISFQSKKIEKIATGYKALGELTLKGITKPVEILFTFTPNGNTGLFKGQFSFRREDFNVGKEGGSVGDMININLEVPVKK